MAALESALAPWHVELVVLPDAFVGASMPASAENGRALAERHAAAAVAWISEDERGASALWIYDRASARVLARALPVAPPFDAPTAASVALAIKTLLRHSTAAPIGERIVETRAPPSELRLELGGGARAFSSSPPDGEPRGLLGLMYWPGALASVLGISATLRGGTGLQISGPSLTGRLVDFDVHLGLRARWGIARWADLTFALEVGITGAFLDARLTSDARVVSSFDVDPTGLVWVEVGLRPVSSLRVGVRVGMFGSARPRSYAVRGVTVLETQPLALEAALVLEVPLDGGSVDSR